MFLMIVAHGTDVSGIYGGHTEAVEAINRPLMPLRGCSKPMVQLLQYLSSALSNSKSETTLPTKEGVVDS